MRRTLPLLTLLSACRAAPDPAAALARGTWVDLSYTYDSTTIYWPTSQPFALERVFAGRTDGGFWYTANNLATAEHGGTHLDAPIHFAEGKLTTDRVPLERLIGPAVVIDVRGAAEADRDRLITPADVVEWENSFGTIPEGTIVLFRTGRGAFWPDRARYLGTTRTGTEGVAELHFPGLDSATARLLVSRGVRAVGIDTPSIDYGRSTTYDAHQVLAGADVPIFENVANLGALPHTGAYVVALPMKIGGGSGGPLRIAAWIPVSGA
jgi:kynurenine formamidase